MVAVKAHQAESFLAAPPQRIDALLFYGSDPGLVMERAQKLAASFAGKSDGEVLRLDDADLESDPDRLAVELTTVSMFAAAKVVRAAAGRRLNAAVLKPLLEGGPFEGRLIVEAGNLKPDDALRMAFERSDRAAAVACYADSAQDLEGLVREVLGGAGITLAADAREALLARLGADRALSRGELEKLVLFAAGRTTLDADTIDSVVGDAAELALERITFAAAAGEGARAVAEMGRAVSSGESAQAVIAATQRHFQRLHRLRSMIDGGRSLDDALRQIRPPLHFRQKDAIAAQCRAWTSRRLADALVRISAAARAARLNGALEEPLAERLLIALAMMREPVQGARRPQ